MFYSIDVFEAKQPDGINHTPAGQTIISFLSFRQVKNPKTCRFGRFCLLQWSQEMYFPYFAAKRPTLALVWICFFLYRSTHWIIWCAILRWMSLFYIWSQNTATHFSAQARDIKILFFCTIWYKTQLKKYSYYNLIELWIKGKRKNPMRWDILRSTPLLM